MEFNLTNYLPSNWLHALGATLFHSLWMGVVLALVVALILLLTRKTSAALRYNLLTGSLCLFVLASGLVFYNALNHHPSLVVGSGVEKNIVITTQATTLAASQANFKSGVSNVINIWEAYSAEIVLVWFLIICIKSIQLLAGLNGVSHIRNNKTYAAGKKWDQVLIELSQRLGISQKVSILQSGIAQVPMVVGHFKPVILIPLGLLNGLSAQEVEAIICHELAHIKRRDYLVNLLQSFIEIIFFFNPAVLWLSKLIRNERENCCDDLAVEQLDDKRSYVKALITCQEFQLNAPSLAMAVNGKKNHLFNRISRMLFDTKTTLNKMEKTILTFALVTVVIGSAAFKNVASSAQSIPHQELQDTTKKKMAKAELAKKQAESDRQQAVIAKKQAVMDSKLAIEDSKQSIEDAKIAAADAKQAKEDARIAAVDARIAKQDALQAEIDAKVAKEDARMHQNSGRKLKALSPITPTPPTPPTPATPGAYEPLSPLSPVAPPTPPTYQSTPPMPPANFNHSGNKKTTSKTGTERTIESISSTDSDAHDYKSIIKEMLRDGLINDTNKLSYKLDKNNLIVNGVKQTESFHKKYKDRYLEKENTSLLYNYETSSSTKTTP
ncbi:M56 family metallopeptidase [Pedobacter aquatilis]|uniref:M56 family metallopeptidase n=1 Tax=Pedobacter aquatilis TaxID=351343 RepID=UPI00292E9FA3|nr:M56 family metallopeptidase [Pedobacter aquatilis]